MTHTDLDFLEELLADEPSKSVVSPYPVPVQNGPLRQFEKEMRCASRGCGSSTFFKLQGIPYCTIHTMRRMNEMLIEFGVEK